MLGQADGDTMGRWHSHQLLKLGCFCLLYLCRCCLCEDGPPPTPSGQSCGQTLTTLTGSFRPLDPPSHSSSPANQECVFLIALPPPHRITITIVTIYPTIRLSNNDSCANFVEVRDGGSGLSPVVSDFSCGQGNLKPTARFRSSGSQMWVRFVSDRLGQFPSVFAFYSSDTLGDNFTLIVDSTHHRLYTLDLFTLSYSPLPLPLPLPLSLSPSKRSGPKAVICDPGSRPVRIFWIESGDSSNSIYTAQVLLHAGSNASVVVRLNNEAELMAIAMDPASNLIFYVDGGNDVIGIASVSTGAYKSIVEIERRNYPRSIVVDYKARVIYWTEGSSLQRSSYNGSDRLTFIQLSLGVTLLSLTLDTETGDLYWLSEDRRGRQRVLWARRNGRGQGLILPRAAELETPAYTWSLLAFYGRSLWLVSHRTQSAFNRVEAGSQLQRMEREEEKGREEGGPNVVWRTEDYRVGGLAFFDQSLPAPEPSACRTKKEACKGICIPVSDKASQCLSPEAGVFPFTLFPTTTGKMQTTTTARKGDNNKDNIALLISLVVGAVAVVIIVTVFVFYRVLKKRRETKEPVEPREGLETADGTRERRRTRTSDMTCGSHSSDHRYSNVYDVTSPLYVDVRTYACFRSSRDRRRHSTNTTTTTNTNSTTTTTTPDFGGEDSQGYMVPKRPGHTRRDVPDFLGEDSQGYMVPNTYPGRPRLNPQACAGPPRERGQYALPDPPARRGAPEQAGGPGGYVNGSFPTSS